MISDKDFVLINFVGRIKQTGKIFDLTDKSVAEKEAIDEKGLKFMPVLVIPNSKYVLPDISKSVLGKAVGEKYVLEIGAKDGFGEFNPRLVKTLGMSTFIENNINPTVGDVVSLDDKIATVLSVGAGRVMVSFNHPLAGKDLVYNIEIVGTVDDDKSRCSAIFEHYAGENPADLKLEENKVYIKSPGKLQQYIIDAVSTDITKYVNKEFKVEIANQ